MRMRILLAAFFLLSANFLNALEVSVSWATFKNSPRNYVELYVFIGGKSITQKQVDSINSVGSVEMTVVFKQNDSIAAASKFRLNGPPTAEPANLQDLRRFALPDGTYELEVTFVDANNPTDKQVFRNQFVLTFGGRETLQASDLVLMTEIIPDTTKNESQFAKNGLLIRPAPANYFDRNHKNLLFYYELYNADTTLKEDFIVSYSIEPKYVENPKPIVINNKRVKAQSTNILAYGFDITKLESGFYQFRLEIKNRNNEILKSRTVDFQRSNPFIVISVDTQRYTRTSNEGLMQEFVGEMDVKALNYSLRALKTRVDPDDYDFLVTVINEDSLMTKRRFLFNYWFRESSEMPEQRHEAFMLIAKKVDEAYANGFGYGFETDRGRVLMKYGQPTNMTSVEDEMNAPPYEIWSYDRIDLLGQNNVKFIFYNPNLMANGHKLLHSNCRGEIQNPRWREELYNSVQSQQRGSRVDGMSIDKNFNRRAEQLFNEN